MTGIVVDAAVVVDVLVDVSPQASIVRARLAREPVPWAAPEIMDAEVAHVLRRQLARGEASSAAAHLALVDLISLPVRRYPHLPFLARALELGDTATIYDALYLALAEALDAPSLTRDAALADVPGIRAAVEPIAPVPYKGTRRRDQDLGGRSSNTDAAARAAPLTGPVRRSAERRTSGPIAWLSRPSGCSAR